MTKCHFGSREIARTEEPAVGEKMRVGGGCGGVGGSVKGEEDGDFMGVFGEEK